MLLPSMSFLHLPIPTPEYFRNSFSIYLILYRVITTPNYIRYFNSYIIQFQIYETLCKISGEFDEETGVQALHLCDFTGSNEAGTKLK